MSTSNSLIKTKLKEIRPKRRYIRWFCAFAAVLLLNSACTESDQQALDITMFDGGLLTDEMINRVAYKNTEQYSKAKEILTPIDNYLQRHEEDATDRELSEQYCLSLPRESIKAKCVESIGHKVEFRNKESVQLIGVANENQVTSRGFLGGNCDYLWMSHWLGGSFTTWGYYGTHYMDIHVNVFLGSESSPDTCARSPFKITSLEAQGEGFVESENCRWIGTSRICDYSRTGTRSRVKYIKNVGPNRQGVSDHVFSGSISTLFRQGLPKQCRIAKIRAKDTKLTFPGGYSGWVTYGVHSRCLKSKQDYSFAHFFQ